MSEGKYDTLFKSFMYFFFEVSYWKISQKTCKYANCNFRKEARALITFYNKRELCTTVTC